MKGKIYAPIFELLSQIDSLFWGYIAFVIIVLLGCCLTFQANFFQFRAIPSILKTFSSLLKSRSENNSRGVHPLKAFFASVGV